MRILYVVGTYAPERCGIAHYTDRLARELRGRGFDVAIAGRPGAAINDPTAPRLPRNDESTAVCVFPTSAPRWTLRSLVDLARLAVRWRADWIHLQYAPSSYDWQRRVAFFPLVARLVPGAPPVATTVHEYGGWALPVRPFAEPVVRPIFQVAERRGWLDREALTLLSLSQKVIATNAEHVAAVAARSPRLAERLRLVPIGPNVGPEAAPEGRAEARAALGVSPDRFVVVFFGFIHPVKGIETLLQAMARAREGRQDLVLWIVGGVHSLALRGSEADSYEAKVRSTILDLTLGDATVLTGFQPDREVGRRLRAADLAVLPFNHGATMKSGTLVTCLSYGLPVITTGGADLRPLRHGTDAWVVPPKNPRLLAEAVVRLAADPPLRRALARGGLAVAASHSWSRIADLHQRIYG